MKLNFKAVLLANRVALFVVYFWFGFLKVVALSPAKGLVSDLLHSTLPIFEADKFLVLFGLFECFLGFVWLWPKLAKVAFWLTAFHLLTTFLPTVFLPDTSWNQLFTPSLVGQYIIKNIVILASTLTLYYAADHNSISVRY